MAYYIQKQLAENPLTTLNDILQLENLCNALGVTGEMLQTITALKLAFEAKESGAHAGGLDESIKAYQERLKELAAGYGTYCPPPQGIVVAQGCLLASPARLKCPVQRGILRAG